MCLSAAGAHATADAEAWLLLTSRAVEDCLSGVREERPNRPRAPPYHARRPGSTANCSPPVDSAKRVHTYGVAATVADSAECRAGNVPCADSGAAFCECPANVARSNGEGLAAVGPELTEFVGASSESKYMGKISQIHQACAYAEQSRRLRQMTSLVAVASCSRGTASCPGWSATMIAPRTAASQVSELGRAFTSAHVLLQYLRAGETYEVCLTTVFRCSR